MMTPGSLIEGKYKVWEEISRFGEEVLYAGQRTSDGASVDVRIVGAKAPRARRKQFGDVANIVVRLDHPNCLCALGAGQLVDRTLYTVSEALNAGPLEALVDKGAPPRVLAEIGSQLMAGLAHLHSQGIIIGCVTPSGVTLGERAGRPRLQLVDFSFARIAARTSTQPECRDLRYLAPEVARGSAATERSDLFSAGHVLGVLASPTTPDALLDVLEGLGRAEAAERITVDEARRRFDAWIAADGSDFDMAWIPDATPGPISTGVFALVEYGAEVPSTQSSEILISTPIAPPDPPALAAAPPAASRSRWGLVAGLAGLALVGGLGAAALRGGDEPKSPPRAAASAALAVGAADPAPAEVAAPAPVQHDDAAPKGNPIVWLAQVNRLDLGAVLPIRERRRLLEELASRGGVHERVNHRWNAMLDLWQAGDAERPCATFAAALASLDGAPEGDAELDLIRRVVVPTSAHGSAAGVAPDDSCAGLQAAFDIYAGPKPEAEPKRTRARRSAKRPAAGSKPSPATSAPTQAPSATAPSVATKLDEDLRDF